MTLIQNYPVVRFTYPIVPDRLGLVCGWVSAMLIDPFPAGSSGDGLVGVVGLLPIRAAHAALRAATAGVVGLAFSARAGHPPGNTREGGLPPCPARQSAVRSTGSTAGPS